MRTAAQEVSRKVHSRRRGTAGRGRRAGTGKAGRTSERDVAKRVGRRAVRAAAGRGGRSPKRGAAGSRVAGGRLGFRLRLVLSVNDQAGRRSSTGEFSVTEGRVPRSWSPERRCQVLAAKLRRKLGVDRLARMLNVLGSAHRLRLLGTLVGGAATYRQLVKATKLRAGPLYHHVNQLRLAGLVRPRERDLYEITALGKKHLLIAAAMGNMR